MDSSNLPPPPPPTSVILNTGSSADVAILPPMSLRAGNLERGWNDPPVFSVEVNAAGKSAPTKLNKRVAYPGITSTSGSAVGAQVLMQPLRPVLTPGNVNEELLRPNLNTVSDPGQAAIFPTPLLPTNIDFIPTFPTPESNQVEVKSGVNNNNDVLHMQTIEDSGVNSSNLSEIITSKEDVLKVLEEALKERSLERKVEEEVRRRLEILSSKWEFLSSEVQMKLGDLTNCLLTNDDKTAETIYLALSSDFMSECGPWIMALKYTLQRK